MNEILEKTKEKKNERIYFPELDGLRFFAFLLVFIHHTSFFSLIPGLSILRTHGWIGVDLFFVLSAFLFTKLLIAEHDKTKKISLKKFYLRRIFRIWPIYYLYIGVAIVFAIFFLDGSLSDYLGIRLNGLLTFTDNIVSAYHGYNTIPLTNHLWTIGYEEQFYIFIPLIILFLVRSSYRTKAIAFGSIIILFTAARILLIQNETPHPAVWVLPITHFESIVLGIVIGFGGFDFLQKKINSLILGGTGILMFIAITFLPDIDQTTQWINFAYILVGISTSLVLFSVLNNKYLKVFFSQKIFIYLGKRSYGLYVYHRLCIVVAMKILDWTSLIPNNSLTVFILALIFTIIVSIFSYQIIEKPFLRLKKKFEVVVSRPI